MRLAGKRGTQVQGLPATPTPIPILAGKGASLEGRRIGDPLPAPLQGTLSPSTVSALSTSLSPAFLPSALLSPSISAHVLLYLCLGQLGMPSLVLWMASGENSQQEPFLENLENSVCGKLEIKRQRKKGVVIMNKAEDGKDFEKL